MALSYYRCDWGHPDNDDPVIIFYEVDDKGHVPRLIEIYADGRHVCISTVDFVGRENEMPGIASLVEGDFLESAKEMLEGPEIDDGPDRISLLGSDKQTFDAAWIAHR